jgi:hypothetical protein
VERGNALESTQMSTAIVVSVSMIAASREPKVS